MLLLTGLPPLPAPASCTSLPSLTFSSSCSSSGLLLIRLLYTLSAFSRRELILATAFFGSSSEVRKFFLSSSVSIGSTAQQGLAVRLYSNLAYLQKPQLLQKKGSFSS